MIEELILAVVQGITEFLPISSSGHLSLISNLISEPDLFFMVTLHFASLIAVLVFLRKDLFEFKKIKDKKIQKKIKYIFLGILPAGLFGFFFSNLVESTLTNFLFLGSGFLLTTLFLFSTKLKKGHLKINARNSFLIGLVQVLALFPGVSRSGVTTSFAIFKKINPLEAGKFSFLIFIPLMFGALFSEISNFYFNWTILFSFLICFMVSLFSLNLFFRIIKKGNFWLFGFWTIAMSFLSFYLYFS